MSYQAQVPLKDRGSLQTSAIILIAVGFLCGGTIPAIFGVIALVQLDTDPYMAQKMNKVGWIIFWVTFALIILFLVVYVVFMVIIFGVATMPFLMGG